MPSMSSAPDLPQNQSLSNSSDGKRKKIPKASSPDRSKARHLPTKSEKLDYNPDEGISNFEIEESNHT